MTGEQVGDVFEQIYGQHYSKASISRMPDYIREDAWALLNRSLESYYSIHFVDCVHIKIHRKRSVDDEAFYVVLGATEYKTREVLGIFNRPEESATGWGEMLEELRERGVQRVELLCADGVRGLDGVLARVFLTTPLQRCVTHLKRGMLNKVRHGDKLELTDDLRQVFITGDKSYTPDMAWERWQKLCEKWGEDYPRTIKKMGTEVDYKLYFAQKNSLVLGQVCPKTKLIKAFFIDLYVH